MLTASTGNRFGNGNKEVAGMGVVFGALAFIAVLAIAALVVLAAIAAVVEILPPPGGRDGDDQRGGPPVGAPISPRRWLANGHGRKPRTGFSH
jgi:hypothetical protein